MGNLVPKKVESKLVSILEIGHQRSKPAGTLRSIGMTQSKGNGNGTLMGNIFYCLKADYCCYSYT